ncbi:FAD-binding oxidoreductase [Streptomyces sp. NPDC053048]|uniref:FAD-binding oxidoreductase n=1 Tax=Streptomyces sp. NPDC053048 TaxID=3365694 RepID=UPI0037D5F052
MAVNAPDRRRVLRTGLGAAVTAGLGLSLTEQPAPATVRPAPARPDVRRPADVDNRAWRDLRDRVRGPLFRPSDSNYWALSLPANHRFADRHPAAVLCPRTTGDITEAIAWVRRQRIPVAVRCGGHNYAGYSSTTGLLVHLAGMRKVEVDVGALTVTVQAGARNSEVYEALKNTDLLLPGSRCPDVGMSGLVLGGGIGMATRRYGLTCDSLLRTTVATSEGEVLMCDERRDADLFWACRGGAGGNFGINTSFTFRLRPVAGVTVYDLAWEWKDAAAVLAAAAEVTGASGETAQDLSCQFGLRTAGDGTRVYAQGLYFGAQDDLERALRPLLKAAAPTRRFIEQRRVWPGMSHFHETPSGNPYLARSIVSKRHLTSGVIDRIVGHLDDWRPRSRASRSTVTFFAMGGKDAAPAPGDTAYVHRDARFILALTTYWSDTDPGPVSDHNTTWLGRLYDDLSKDLGTAAYQNFPDPELERWWSAYYGSNYNRLVKIKEDYDPSGLFRYPQAVRDRPGS